MAVVDAVQVHLEDVALAVAAVDERGQDDFFELALNGSLVADDQVFNELLGDGTAAFDDVSGAQVVQGGTDDAQQVYALVGPEVFIFGDDGGVLQERRDLVEFDGSMYALVGQLREQYALAVIDFEVIERQQTAEGDYLVLVLELGLVEEAIGCEVTSGSERDKKSQAQRCDGPDGGPEAEVGATVAGTRTAQVFAREMAQQFLPPGASV